MKHIFQSLLIVYLLIWSSTELQAQRSSHSSSSLYNYSLPKSSYKSSSTYKSPTYDLGGTKYKLGEFYKTTGLPKVERSTSAKREFLKSEGYNKEPVGYEVDHIIPLSKGGADKPYNMQLLPKELHKQKTVSERKRNF